MQTIVSAFHASKDLAVVQLSSSVQDTLEYITSEKAFAHNLIQVKELDQAGSVNTVYVINSSDRLVFLMDGDILVGAKQNRVVNTSILLSSNSKTSIPVSCVEAGRWRHTSASFSGAEYSAPAGLRAEKARHVSESLKQKRGFEANQGEIWDGVAKYENLYQMKSNTANLADIFDKKALEFDKLIGEFTPADGANGVAVFFGKHLATLDLFNRRDAFLEYLPKILKGAIFEANARKKPKEMIAEAEARYKTLEILDAIEEGEFNERPAIGLGRDRRFESKEFSGFELIHEGELVHLALFGGKAAS